MSPRNRIVLDCNIIVQAAFNPFASSGKVVQLVLDGQLTLALSRPILTEVRRTLLHPSITDRYPAVTPTYVDQFLFHLRYRALRPDPIPQLFSLPRDPRDEPYLNLAAAASAHFLVSRDKDLLSLPTDPSDLGNAFRRTFRSLSILTPADLLQRLPHPT